MHLEALLLFQAGCKGAFKSILMKKIFLGISLLGSLPMARSQEIVWHVKPTYENMIGLGLVSERSQWGIISPTGTIIAPTTHESYRISTGNSSMYGLQKKGKYSLYSTQLKQMSPLIVDDMLENQFPFGVVIVRKGSLWGGIDGAKGTFVVPPKYSSATAYEYYNEMWCSKVIWNGKPYLLDPQGKEIPDEPLPPQPDMNAMVRESGAREPSISLNTLADVFKVYQEVRALDSNYYRVRINENWGITTVRGQVVVPLQYKPYFFRAGNQMRCTLQNGLVVLVSLESGQEISTAYQQLAPLTQGSSQWIFTEKSLQGLLDPQKGILQPAIYQELIYNDSSSVWFKKDNLYGIMRPDGTIVYDNLFESIFRYEKILWVRYKGLWGRPKL
jgi:hypothetical protein